MCVCVCVCVCVKCVVGIKIIWYNYAYLNEKYIKRYDIGQYRN